MRFELVGKRLINMEHVQEIRQMDLPASTTETLQYQIEFVLTSGDVVALGYPNVMDRDLKFRNLSNAFVGK